MSKEIERLAKELWETLAERRGCKLNQEDCSFQQCHSWAECKLLIEQLAKYVQQEILKGQVEELSQEIIPIFDGLFTDGDYRKSFYAAIETRIEELKSKIKEGEG